MTCRVFSHFAFAVSVFALETSGALLSGRILPVTCPNSWSIIRARAGSHGQGFSDRGLLAHARYCSGNWT